MTTVLQQVENYQVLWLVRRLFRVLAQRSDEMLQKHGVTAADRAVMEFLFPNRALSVPQIAREYDVSRQHVQVTVNRLIEKGCIEVSVNPTHKRSPLMHLTAKGRRLFKTILKHEKQVLSKFFENISRQDSRTTRKTLQALLTAARKGETS